MLIIIWQNSSKSMVPDPSSSISSMMPSRSSEVSLGSSSAMISRSWPVVMKPAPSLENEKGMNEETISWEIVVF